MLELEGVTSGYDGIPIIRDVTFEIGEGQILAVVGRNGAGKTTLARTIIGLLQPSRGKILLRGEDVTRSDARERALAGIGYVPQGRGIFGRLTVDENLLLGTAVGKRAASERALVDVYKLFPILEQRRLQKGGTLSGGEQQMLAIGRVLIGAPSLLVLDEPSDGIQPSIVEQISNLVVQLNQDHGLTTLLVEQNIDMVVSCAHRCFVMDKGSIVTEVSPKGLEDPEFARQYLAV